MSYSEISTLFNSRNHCNAQPFESHTFLRLNMKHKKVWMNLFSQYTLSTYNWTAIFLLQQEESSMSKIDSMMFPLCFSTCMASQPRAGSSLKECSYLKGTKHGLTSSSHIPGSLHSVVEVGNLIYEIYTEISYSSHKHYRQPALKWHYIPHTLTQIPQLPM